MCVILASPWILCGVDNNYMDDIGLYAKGQNWLNNKHIMGRAVGFLPSVGMVTIIMNDYPACKVWTVGSRAWQRNCDRPLLPSSLFHDTALTTPHAQYILIGILGLLVITNKDS